MWNLKARQDLTVEEVVEYKMLYEVIGWGPQESELWIKTPLKHKLGKYLMLRLKFDIRTITNERVSELLARTGSPATAITQAAATPNLLGTVILPYTEGN
ncbi:hypothetical protein J6590_096625 [Homalodisca vitripennis]|nr:hypothetical protein J6590_096625 [Homalodisca vitripennis]